MQCSVCHQCLRAGGKQRGKNLISRCLVFKNKRQSEAQEESSRKEAESYFSAYVRGRGGRGSGLGGAGVRGVRRGVGGI